MQRLPKPRMPILYSRFELAKLAQDCLLLQLGIPISTLLSKSKCLKAPLVANGPVHGLG